MKRNSLIFSILTMVLCASLIAGSSFALFTSESKVNVAVTAGTVDVEASISELELYSPTAIDLNGVITDDKNAATTTFANGGTATLKDGTLTLTNITPGDKVKFTIGIANKSNVNIEYRTSIRYDDNSGDNDYYYLSEALKFNIGGEEVTGSSVWTELAAGETITALPCYIELPAKAGNNYQSKSCTIIFKIEAVQGNAETVIYSHDVAEILAAMKAGKTIFLDDDVVMGRNDWLYIGYGNPVTTTLNLNNHNISFSEHHPNGDVFRAEYDAKIIVNGEGDVTSPQASFLAAWGGRIVINGGDYTVTGGAYEGVAFCYGDGVIEINGGTFKHERNPSCTLKTYSTMGSNPGLILLKGGSFYKFDPSAYNNSQFADFEEENGRQYGIRVADGYKVVQDGDWYTVVADAD